jgi:soluble lytic murein transglycosylase-like protein
MRQELAFRPCAVSPAGAMGLIEIMLSTEETLGLEDAFSPGENVEAGAGYLKQPLDRYHGDRRLALGAYNAGPSRVDNAGRIPGVLSPQPSWSVPPHFLFCQRRACRCGDTKVWHIDCGWSGLPACREEAV